MSSMSRISTTGPLENGPLFHQVPSPRPPLLHERYITASEKAHGLCVEVAHCRVQREVSRDALLSNAMKPSGFSTE